MQAIDETSERQDLAVRSEIKYAIPNVDVGKLRSHLDGNCRRLIHNRPVSVVRSVYFDDAQLSAMHANIDGVTSRRKLRLRWYDSLQPGRLAFLEVKWRENRTTGKHRLRLESGQQLGNIGYQQLGSMLESSVPQTYQHALVRCPEPAVIVEYCREHFAADDGQVRLTLDYNLTWYDQMGRPRLTTEFPVRMENFAVIEGKLRPGQEARLREVLHPFVPRANRCSKYVHGCQLLGHTFSED